MNLNAIQTIYAMLVSACLTLGVVHLLVWLKVRQAPSNLLFSLGVGISLVFLSYFELAMMNATTTESYLRALRWLHAPVWIIVILTLGFVLVHLRAGRLWLALLAGGVRTVSLIVNFLAETNLNYTTLERLEVISVLGDDVKVAVGTPNPWMLLGQLSLLLMLAFIVDAMITLWKRGERRRAMIFGPSMLVFVLVPTVINALIVLGVLEWPALVGVFHAPVVAAMSYEMSRDLVRAHWLSRRLQAANDELLISETRLKLAAESARLAVWEWRPESNRLWMTEAAKTMFGVPVGTPIDMSLFYSAVHPDDLADLKRAIQCSAEFGESLIRDYRIVLPDGSIRWIASRGRFDTAEDGAERVMRGVIFDVTETKLAEARFRRVVEVSPIGKLISDMHGKIIFANPMAATYFGYAAGELEGLSIDLLLPDYAECVGSAPEVPATARDVIGMQKDGGEIPLQMNVSLLPSADDGILLTTLVDISERKQREEQLWRDKNFLRAVIDANPCYIFVKDHTGRFTLVNRNVADLFGLAPRDVIGKTHTELSANAEQARIFERDDQTVIETQRELIINEEKLTDALGRERLFQTIKRPIIDRDGKRRLVLGVSTDITARKQAELEIERQRNELTHLSRITMLSELSGSLAHELNQPLAAILANAQAAQRFLAKEPPDLDEVRDILNDIIEDDRQAGGVIQGLRLLLRKGEMRQEQFDVNEAVQSVLKLVRSDLLNAKVSVETDLAPCLPKILGDRVQLQQVLINLVINANEAMADQAPGDRRLVIRTGVGNDREVWLEVLDNGHGIAAEQIPHLFTPFYSTKAHGLGIGLSVCRRIIESHGGDLQAANRPEGGACFKFSLPAVAEETS